MLLYVSEGFMPFLQIFYSKFYRKRDYDQIELEGNTTDLLYKAMLVSSPTHFVVDTFTIPFTYIAGLPLSSELPESVLLPGDSSGTVLSNFVPPQTTCLL